MTFNTHVITDNYYTQVITDDYYTQLITDDYYIYIIIVRRSFYRMATYLNYYYA